MNEKWRVIEMKGGAEGPTSVIMAGVHGDERCGIEAFEKIIPALTLDKGRVLFVYGNPRAIDLNQRFTETNLNRMFKPDKLLTPEEKGSYEYQRAQELKEYLNQADVLLDIHASSNSESRPFLICEPNSRDVTQLLPFPTVVYGFDNVEPGGTDYYMNSIGKIGICAECGYANDPLSTEVATQAIYSFLTAQGHISGNKNSQTNQHQLTINMYLLYLTKSDTFRLAKKFSDFEKITRGQLIGLDGENQVRAQEDGIILFPHNCDKKGSEAFLLGK